MRFLFMFTHLKFNIAPERVTLPKGKDRFPSIIFQGLC